MISWLIQSQTNMPQFAEGADNGFLSTVESERLLTLKTAKRQRDWLLGRWTAKQLLQTLMWQMDGVLWPLESIAITNDDDGVPFCKIAVSNRHYTISISHSHDYALVAAIDKPDVRLGVDMERIKVRPDGFPETYFTMTEMGLGRCLWGPDRAVWETAVWSAKEAVLKALHLGLSVDTRSVSCLIKPLGCLPQGWIPFGIEGANGRFSSKAQTLRGWWQVYEEFVVTVVA